MPWQPLLEGRAAETTRDRVQQIAEALEGAVDAIEDPSLAQGHAGIAMFFAQLATAWEDPRWADNAMKSLERALEGAAARTSTLGLFGGLSGIAWATQHVTKLLQGVAVVDTTEEVDEALREALEAKPWVFDYDLMWGLVGIGCYALDHPDPALGAATLRKVIGHLEELARPSQNGYAWWSSPALLTAEIVKLYPDGYFDLGVAHGTAGVIGLLARAHEREVARPKTERLLEGAVMWLLANRRCAGSGSAFAYHAGEDRNARSAWCYGDPGVAVALMSAGISADRPDWRDLALALLRRDSTRTEAETEIVDAGLCHGAAGLAHLCNRLHQATGDRVFADRAREWFARTLEMCRPEGIAGFASWWPEAQRWHADSGLLAGAAGIGLALLAATSAQAPDWDRTMLVDLRPL